MPFKKVGPGLYVSPSGKQWTQKQVEKYYATNGVGKGIDPTLGYGSDRNSLGSQGKSSGVSPNTSQLKSDKPNYKKKKASL